MHKSNPVATYGNPFDHERNIEYYARLQCGAQETGCAWKQVSHRVSSLSDIDIPGHVLLSPAVIQIVGVNSKRDIDVIGEAQACEARQLLKTCLHFESSMGRR